MTVEIDKQVVMDILREEIREGLKPALRLAALREKTFLSGKEVQDLYGISEQALRCSRTKCKSVTVKGPKFYKSHSGKIFYEHCDVVEFIKSTHG